MSQISQENACVRASLKVAVQTPTWVSSWEIYETFQNTYFEGHLRSAASVLSCVFRLIFYVISSVGFSWLYICFKIA